MDIWNGFKLYVPRCNIQNRLDLAEKAVALKRVYLKDLAISRKLSIDLLLPINHQVTGIVTKICLKSEIYLTLSDISKGHSLLLFDKKQDVHSVARFCKLNMLLKYSAIWKY